MKQTINPIGKEINTLGKVINNKELMLVHLHLKSGEQIPSHDHKGQEVFFTLWQELWRLLLTIPRYIVSAQAPFYISPAKLM